MQHVWLAIILAVGPGDASAQAQPVGAIAALVGQGTVIHAAVVERTPAKVRDEIFVRDRIETRSEEHTSELQSLAYLVCRLLLEKKKKARLKKMCSCSRSRMRS